MARQVGESPEWLHAFLDEHASLLVRIRDQARKVAPEKEERVEPAHERVLGLFRWHEGKQRVTILGEHQAIVRRVERDESQGQDGRLRRLDAQRREPPELSERRRSDPAEEAPRELSISLILGQSEFRERVRPPRRVAIALLVETAVRRHPPDFSLGLEVSERQRQRRGQSLLLSFGSEASRRAAGRGPQLVRPERVLAERLQHGGRQLVDLGVGHAQLARDLHLLLVTKPLPDLERQREVGSRDDVGAAARARQLVDRKPRDRGLRHRASDPGSGVKRQVGTRAADRARPAGLFEHIRRRGLLQGPVEALPVPPPRAKLFFVHRWVLPSGENSPKAGRSRKPCPSPVPPRWVAGLKRPAL